MKNKYLKTMRECVAATGQESCNNAVIDRAFSDEIILEKIYSLQMDLAEYLTRQDYFDSKSELTLQEINRLENQLN
ncbi:MAG: hypothetical protein WD512_09390 [Candidatus Paceibacterota bacterium]